MKCLRCGNCCSSETLLEYCNEEEKTVFKMIYALIGKDINNTKCPHLDFKLGMAICKIYNNRPLFCKKYFCKKANKNKKGFTIDKKSFNNLKNIKNPEYQREE